MSIVSPVTSSTHLLAFVLMAFAFVAVPGPSVVFVVSRALVLGRRGALATVVGNAAGVYVQVVAVSIGLGALVERSIVAFTILKFGGAAYLAYLGVQAIRHRRDLSQRPGVDVEVPRMLRAVRDGFIVGVANPKAVVYFAAVLPQFVDPAGIHPSLQMLVLGAICVAIALISDGVWAVSASAARAWFARSPRRLERIGAVGGVAMIGIGARLAVSGRPD